MRRRAFPYVRFALTLLASLAAMFVISLEQVRSLEHLYLNVSDPYVSIAGVGAMGLIMFLAMRRMFPDRLRNLATVGALTVLLVGGFALARTELFVRDRGFLESMIPHHSRAILVCQESSISDPETAELCDGSSRASHGRSSR